MDTKVYPVIDLVATGNNIRRLRLERGMTVRDLQRYFGFEEPRAIYKWQKGESLPTVDNLYALGNLFEIPMDQILVPVAVELHIIDEQQDESCCSNHFKTGYFGYGKNPMQLQPFYPFALSAARLATLSALLTEKKSINMLNDIFLVISKLGLIISIMEMSV